MNIQQLITYSFYLLFFLTPFIWTSVNFELFEYNKMIFVYLLTAVITQAWIYRMVEEKRVIFRTTPLDIPLLLFLFANIVSTVFSIDTHTSIWGYYSRSNGGLLSLVSYLLLYFAFVSNVETKQVSNILKAGLLSGLIISLYAILEHFGVSPSCVILRGELNASCWVQDVQARVFATLGQPNWLAAYLAMLIFPAFYFLLTETKKNMLIAYSLTLIAFYTAFTFTYSRGATLGLVVSLTVFLGLIFFDRTFYPLAQYLKLQFLPPKPNPLTKDVQKNFKPLFLVLAGFLLINLVFGSALTRFQLDKIFSKPTAPQAPERQAPIVTQLEVGGTESGKIRLIVWEGALEIFKNYHLFGSGVETFAYSYYNFRPVAHNLTSEWDFLYNKAHNEFLNYLATTGLFGFLSYLGIIIAFIYWSIRIMNQELRIKDKKRDSRFLILASLLASYISFLIQNFFLFSVVITALFFYLFPALAFVATDSTKPLKLPKKISNFQFSILSLVYRRPLYTEAAKALVIISTLYLLFSILQIWRADTFFAKSQRAIETGNAGRAYNQALLAVRLNPREPFYRSELAYAAASSALALSDTDATLSAQLKNEAVQEIEHVLKNSPKNISFWRTTIRTYYQLGAIEESFTQKTLYALDEAIKLAPTDPKFYYNKAVILGQMDQTEEAIQALEKAIELKPNYREGYIALALFHFDSGNQTEAVKHMSTVLKLVPNDPEAVQHLVDWGKQGVATGSATQ